MKFFSIAILLFISSIITAQNFVWTPQNSGVTSILRDVHFANNQTGWAVGDDGVILNTTNGGQTWLPQVSGTTERLRSVFFVNTTTGWAVGGSLSKVILKTTNGGSSWQSISAPNIISSMIYDIAFNDVNTGWLVAFDSIYRSTDGGNTWLGESYANGVLSQTIKNIAVTSDSTAYVGGSMKPGVNPRAAQIFHRRPDITTNLWGISGFDKNVTGEEIMSIHFINAEIGFAGGTSGKLYRKSNLDPSGVWYINKDVSSNASLISAVSFPSESNGMFCAIVSAGPSYTIIYHTVDTGDTWSNAPDTIPNFTNPTLYAPSNDTAWIVGYGGKIYKGTRSPVGITEIGINMDINVYPNPAIDLLNVNINSKTSEDVKYILTDVTGRTIEQGIWSVNSANSSFSINLSEYKVGMYFLNLIAEQGKTSFKILKK